jgi:hypothetical protein
MAHEFNNRISAQRNIVRLVNESASPREQLCGLSEKALDRWASTNSITVESPLFLFIKEASEKLFFLANKSQEEITDEYASISNEIAFLSQKIQNELSK